MISGPGKRVTARVAAWTVAVACALGAGCTASSIDEEPPEQQFYFPTGTALSLDESVLFVESANGDLKYNSGSIAVVDLAMVDSVAAAWTANKTAPDGCTGDVDYTETLICDETNFIEARKGARIGNFSTDIAVQDRGGGALRLIAPTRGDPSITWLDWDGTELDCSNGDAYSLCDDAHRLSFVQNDESLQTIPDEPFNAFADSTGEYAVVTHLSTGAVTLIASPANGSAEIVDINPTFFEPNLLTGLIGASGIAGRTPGATNDIIYVGSPDENRVQTLTIDAPVNAADSSIVPGNYFFESAVGVNAGSSSDTRGMMFSQGGDRLYIVQRDPPTVQIYDTSIGTEGFPNNQLVGATDICREASTITVADTGAGERAYVTCFLDGQVYVVDPRGLGSVEDVITVGRGPYAIAASASRKKLYVTNYLEDTVSVIDLTPGSPTQYRVVLRLGVPKPPDQSGTT